MVIVPVFRNGSVARVTLPRLVLRHLGVKPGDYIVMDAAPGRSVVVHALDLQKVKDEQKRGREALLFGGAGSSPAARAR